MLLRADLRIALPLNLSCFIQKLQFCNIVIFQNLLINWVYRKNITQNKVLESHDGCEELFVSVGKAYITLALMIFFEMERIDDYPIAHCFENNMVHNPYGTRKQYFDDKIGQFVDNYIFRYNQSSPCGAEEVFVNNYVLCFTYLPLFLMKLIDTTKKADGDRNLINQNILLIIFRSLRFYCKYATEMFVSIAEIEFRITPRLSEEFLWEFFCSWTGGKTKNIDDDLPQESYKNISKNTIKHLGSNKSIQTIEKYVDLKVE